MLNSTSGNFIKRIMQQKRIEEIRNRFRAGDFAISDHAIIEARKDGIEPATIKKLEWVAIHGKIIEEYPDRDRILVYAELPDVRLPVHLVIDFSVLEEPVIVTAYVPDNRYLYKYQVRKQ